MEFILMDVKAGSEILTNNSVTILVVVALIAIVAIVLIFLWRKKKNKK